MPSWAVSAPSWIILAPSWAILGHRKRQDTNTSYFTFLALPGPYCSHPGVILDPSWGHLETFLGHLGGTLGHLSPISGDLGAFLGHLGASSGHLSEILGHLWPQKAPRGENIVFHCVFWPLRGHLAAILGSSRAHLGAVLGHRGAILARP